MRRSCRRSSQNIRIVGRPLDAAIGAVVVVGAVAVVLAVGLVVLVLVAHEIGEREAVMHRDVVDAGARAAAVVVEQVGGAGHAAADLAEQVAFAAPVAAQRSAIMIVPFRPAGRKAADLIAAGADVPRLGDQLDAGQHRILPDRGEERGAAVEAVWSAAERAGEIEAEAVDVTDLDPVAQRIHHHLQHARMA